MHLGRSQRRVRTAETVFTYINTCFSDRSKALFSRTVLCIPQDYASLFPLRHRGA
jgi:hypothetical protein